MLRALGLTCALASMSAMADAPKNIIFFIGDGMGPAYTSAYRYYVADSDVDRVKPTVFDRLLAGSASTFPHDDTVVTDSAASATALATGVKSYNGAIGVDVDKSPLDSVLVKAKQAGWQTGVISTSQVNHATPASFVAHAQSRKDYQEIAEQFYSRRIDGKPLVDVILGGGQKYFSLEEQGLGSKMVDWGYQYVRSFDALPELTQTPAMGLFADVGLDYAIDAEQPLRLSKMLDTALRLFENKSDPFFLMVEGSQIDWCGHGNDIACAMAEMTDFAAALELAEAYAKRHGDTLVVYTADHSTGGLTLGNKGNYRWDAKVVKQVDASLMVINESIEGLSGDALTKALAKNIAFEFSDNERFALESLKNHSDSRYWLLVEFVSRRSHTGWTTKGHDAIDVPVGAIGPMSDKFVGYHDNIELGQSLIDLVN